MRLSQHRSLNERIYLRLLAHSQQTPSRPPRESLADNSLVFYSPTLGIMTEWDLARAYSNGNRLLTESESRRGRLIVETLFQRAASAFTWMGQKLGAGVDAAVKFGDAALDVAGKCLTKLLETIPGGEDAFEFLKEFTAEQAGKVSGYVAQAAKEFGSFLTDKKAEILGAVFQAGAEDPGVVAKLKELVEKGQKDFGDEVEKVKDFVKEFTKDPLAAAKKFFNIRKIVGSIVGSIVGMILKKGGEVAKKITGVFDSAGFTKSKLGMFFLRVMSFFTTDMAGEDVLDAAAKMWTSAKKLSDDRMDAEHRGRALVAVIPKIVKGLIGGDSALEGVLRASVGDPTAIPKLLKNATKMIWNALAKLISKGAAKVVASVGVDPNGKLGKIVIGGMMGLVGQEPGGD